MLAICFDADGTLFHSTTSVGDLWRAFCSERHCVVSSEEATAIAGSVGARFHQRWLHLWDAKLGRTIGEDAEDGFWLEYNAAVLANWGLAEHAHEALRWFNRVEPDNTAALYDDTVPALRTLAERKVTMAVYSNRLTSIVPTLRRLGVADFFAWVRSAGDTGIAKPNSEAFRMVADALGVSMASLAYVGNSVTEDYHGARSAGCQSILIDRARRHQSETGLLVIHSLLDIPTRLRV